MQWLFVIACAVSAACVRSTSVQCDDGTLCPQATVCDTVHSLCITPEQATACGALVDGDLCHADGRDARCDLGSCLPACGDGVLDDGEQCDDAGFTSHDGCSSACVAETLASEQWKSPWRKRCPRAREAA